MIFKLNLQQFSEVGGAAAPAAGGEATATNTAESAPATPEAAAPVNTGDVLPDGTKVQSARVAAAMNRQMQKHPELRNVYGKGQPAQNAPQAEAAPAGPSIEERWAEAKKGEFAELYGRDVQAAIRDRFKNQQETQGQLDKLEPMLKVLRDRAGVESNDDLIKTVMDDDSLYEEEASAHGMTIPAYREFKQAQEQLQQMQQAEAQRQETARIQQHFGKLQEQANAMKAMYPDFNLEKELQNPNFLRLTSPEVGISVEDAYYAVHHKELAPQMMAYGMERAKQQMGQTLQAQRARPAEGAMKVQGQPAAEVKINPRNMTREERNEIKRQVRLGRRVSFD